MSSSEDIQKFFDESNKAVWGQRGLKHHTQQIRETLSTKFPQYEWFVMGFWKTERRPEFVSCGEKDRVYSWKYKGRCVVAVQKTLARGATPTDELVRLSASGDTEKVKSLLDNDADVNGFDVNGHLALNRATAHKHVDVIEMLIANAANVNMNDDSGKSPLAVACSRGFVEIAETLILHKALVTEIAHKSKTLLHLAAESNRLDVAKLLISQNCGINGKTNLGFTALHTAANGGFTDVVKLLVSHEADINIPDNTGTTALLWALSSDHLDAFRYLEQQHAHVHQTVRGARTILFHATRQIKQNNNRDVLEVAQRRFGFFEPKPIAFDEISPTSPLSSTNFSTVLKAKWLIGEVKNKEAVHLEVVCKIRDDQIPENDWYELQILKVMPYHENVLGLLGICYDFQHEGDTVTALISLHKPGGSLKDFIKQQREPLSLRLLVEFGLQMSRGLLHIHKNQTKHNDIAARNFLLQEHQHKISEQKQQEGVQQVVVLTDFRLARPVNFDEKNKLIPWRWCATETLSSNGYVTNQKTDIWMLGIAFWEMVNPRKRPFDKITKPVTIVQQTQKLKTVPLMFGKPCPLKWRTLIRNICAYEPNDRPSAFKLISMLGDLTTEAEDSNPGALLEDDGSENRQKDDVETYLKVTDFEEIPGKFDEDLYIRARSYTGFFCTDEDEPADAVEEDIYHSLQSEGTDEASSSKHSAERLAVINSDTSSGDGIKSTVSSGTSSIFNPQNTITGPASSPDQNKTRKKKNLMLRANQFREADVNTGNPVERQKSNLTLTMENKKYQNEIGRMFTENEQLQARLSRLQNGLSSPVSPSIASSGFYSPASDKSEHKFDVDIPITDDEIQSYSRLPTVKVQHNQLLSMDDSSDDDFELQAPKKEEEPVIEGYLFKKNPGGIPGMRIWKQRYCVLISGSFHYFAKRGENSPLGSLTKKDIIDADCPNEGKKAHEKRFIIHIRGGGRAYEFRAQNSETAKKWVDEVRKLVRNEK